MLSSGVPAATLWGPKLTSFLSSAGTRVANLECCLVPEGTPPTRSQKAFKFLSEETHGISALLAVKINAVSIANNHVGDADEGFVTTPRALDSVGIAHAGAGPDAAAAWAPARFTAEDGTRISLFSFADFGNSQDGEWAAAPLPLGRPGLAAKELGDEALSWLCKAAKTERASGQQIVMCAVHWGANYVPQVPHQHIVFGRGAIAIGGVDVVVGTSSHHPLAIEFVSKTSDIDPSRQGVVLYGLGDALDDYALDASFRNDLGIAATVKFDVARGTVLSVEALPLKLEFCKTDAAKPASAHELTTRLTAACAPFGTYVLGPRADGTLKIGRVPVV